MEVILNLLNKMKDIYCHFKLTVKKVQLNTGEWKPQLGGLPPCGRACSLTRNITSHSMKNLAFHSLHRWKVVILPILPTSLIHLSLKGLENVVLELGSERVKVMFIMPRVYLGSHGLCSKIACFHAGVHCQQLICNLPSMNLKPKQRRKSTKIASTSAVNLPYTAV